jgi:STE24 endopeptidase
MVKILNLQHLNPILPKEFAGIFDSEKYKTSQNYTRDKTKLSLITSSVSIIITIPFILLGGFNIVDTISRSFGFGEIISGLFFVGILSFASSILALPAELYDTFVLEERYGFNKTTIKTFVIDKIKGLVLGIIIGIPIFSLIIWFFLKFGKGAWLNVWIAITCIQMLLMYIAPTFIMPLFNKFSPLEDGELKEKIESYAKKYNFKLKGIFTMDGSKRSAKSNAFFTGFGKNRRIVLFDTLIEQQTTDGLLAILAHEMGHYKKGHIFKTIIISILHMGFMLFVISLFINNQKLFDAFKMENLSVYASLLFFMFLYSPISTILGVVMSYFSRKNEYEADQFAIETTGLKDEFIGALKQLSVENLSNLTPHPLNVFLNYSHPPVLQRIEAIRKL